MVGLVVIKVKVGLIVKLAVLVDAKMQAKDLILPVDLLKRNVKL